MVGEPCKRTPAYAILSQGREEANSSGGRHRFSNVALRVHVACCYLRCRHPCCLTAWWSSMCHCCACISVDLPLLGIDLLCFAGSRLLCVVDLQPIDRQQHNLFSSNQLLQVRGANRGALHLAIYSIRCHAISTLSRI